MEKQTDGYILIWQSMKEKIKLQRGDSWMSGYFKPKGKYSKRAIHKKLRKMEGNFRQGIMNRIGVHMEWC